MEVRSIYKYARISQLKARDVAREIQGLPASAALDTLNFTPRKAAAIIVKTLKSAIANAENNHDLDVTTLVVKEATVGKGPSFRRFKARARGSASPIRKPTSHISIILTDEIEIPEPRKRSTGTSKRKASKPTSPNRQSPTKAEVVAPRQVDKDETPETETDESPKAENTAEATAETEVQAAEPESEEATATAEAEEATATDEAEEAAGTDEAQAASEGEEPEAASEPEAEAPPKKRPPKLAKLKTPPPPKEDAEN
ncbi:hypothetical protein BH23VER1_BH23VER1_17350 [soil metagenome]